MHIGDLDRRISIQQSQWVSAGTQDSYGQPNNYPTGTWSQLGPATTVWAYAEWHDGASAQETNKVVSTEKTTFTIRAIGWTQAMLSVLGTGRILMDTAYYYIKGVKMIDGRDQFIELETELKRD